MIGTFTAVRLMIPNLSPAAPVIQDLECSVEMQGCWRGHRNTKGVNAKRKPTNIRSLNLILVFRHINNFQCSWQEFTVSDGVVLSYTVFKTTYLPTREL